MTIGRLDASASASLLTSLLQQLASQNKTNAFPATTPATPTNSSPTTNSTSIAGPTLTSTSTASSQVYAVSEVLNGLASALQNAAVAAFAASAQASNVGGLNIASQALPGAGPALNSVSNASTASALVAANPAQYTVNTTQTGANNGASKPDSAASRIHAHHPDGHADVDADGSKARSINTSGAASSAPISASNSAVAAIASQLAAWLKAAGVQSSSTLSTSA